MSYYKTCTKCDERKELIRFAKHAKSRDGYKNVCRKCNGLDVEAVKSVKHRIREYFENKVINP